MWAPPLHLRRRCTGETRNKTIGVDNDNTITKSNESNNSTEDVTINPIVSEENNNVQIEIDNLNEQNINDDSNGFVNHIESNNNLNKEELTIDYCEHLLKEGKLKLPNMHKL